MKKYKMLGGGFITALTNAELVHILNSKSYFGYKDNPEEFMQLTAEACLLQNGSVIRFDTYDNFVADLIAKGFLTEVE